MGLRKRAHAPCHLHAQTPLAAPKVPVAGPAAAAAATGTGLRLCLAASAALAALSACTQAARAARWALKASLPTRLDAAVADMGRRRVGACCKLCMRGTHLACVRGEAGRQEAEGEDWADVGAAGGGERPWIAGCTCWCCCCC